VIWITNHFQKKEEKKEGKGKERKRIQKGSQAKNDNIRITVKEINK